MSLLSTSAVAAVAALLITAGQAKADATAAQAAAVVVAGQSPGATLTVADVAESGTDLLALTLVVPGDSRPGEIEGVEIEPSPLWPDEVVLAAQTRRVDNDATRVFVGGAVSAAAASVEVAFPGGQVVRLPTLPGDLYVGRHAGRVRFFLGEITLPVKADDEPALVRMLDASGTVIGVADRSEGIERRVQVLRRRADGTVMGFDATLTSRLAPLPGAPEHRADSLCLSVAVLDAAGGDEVNVACQDSRRPLTLGGMLGCGRVPTSIAGFAPAATRTLVVRLGSGRTVRLPTRALPFGRPGRFVTAMLPRGEAIRKAWALDGAGRTLASGALRVAPPDRRCDERLESDRLERWDFASDAPAPRLGTPPGSEVAAEVGAARLLVRDAGEQVCVGIDRLDLDGGDCFSPPFNSHHDDGGLYVDPERGIVAGVYPAQVTAANLRFRGGDKLWVAANVGLGYTGRYRGALHFLMASIPPGKTVVGATLLDASRRAIGQVTADGPGRDLTLLERPSTVLSVGSGRAAVRLVVGAKVGALFAKPLACLGIELARERGRCDDDLDLLDFNRVTARVSCERRRTIVFGMARRAIKRVELILSDGRRVRPRLVKFPRASTSSVFLAVFPSRVAVTRVRFLGRHQFDDTDTVALPAREPARQCGYETSGVLG